MTPHGGVGGRRRAGRRELWHENMSRRRGMRLLRGRCIYEGQKACTGPDGPGPQRRRARRHQRAAIEVLRGNGVQMMERPCRRAGGAQAPAMPSGNKRTLGSRLSALGSRLSALGSRLSALGSRLSALGSRLSALGSRLSALGSRLSALGSRLSALGSRLSALGSRLSALGSRLSALGSRLSALGSRLSALGSRLSAPNEFVPGVGPCQGVFFR